MNARSFFKTQLPALLVALAASIILPGCSKDFPPNEASIEFLKRFKCPPGKVPWDIKNIPAFLIDQQNTQINTQFYYNLNMQPMGQVFTPTIHALDVVELWHDDASCSLVVSNGGNFKVVIKEGNILGKVIATSNTIHFPNCFVGISRLDFPAFVPVEPNKPYVIQMLHVSGNTSSFMMTINGSTYAGGTMIINGDVHPDKDVWFKEGLANFIVRNKDQAKNGGWKKLVRHDGTTFRSEGDCIQYINTGR